MMTGTLQTAGECLSIECELGWVEKHLKQGTAAELHENDARMPTVRLIVERSSAPFDVGSADRVTRGVWQAGGAVVIEDACSSGFMLHCRPEGGVLLVRARWVPPTRTRAAAALLRQRSSMLMRAVLLQYPVLWWSVVHGCAPLHVSALNLGTSVPLLVGPGGVGKSTLVETELTAGHHATCDNLAVTDGRLVHGLVEPRRILGGTGHRTSHGRREADMPERVASIQPDRVVAVSLSETSLEAALHPVEAEVACRSLVTGTYMAGELRRFWPFAAALSSGTGCGPAAPPVQAMAQRLTEALPCFSLTLSRRSGARLEQLLVDSTVGA